jgi:hypothetical protein
MKTVTRSKLVYGPRGAALVILSAMFGIASGCSDPTPSADVNDNGAPKAGTSYDASGQDRSVAADTAMSPDLSASDHPAEADPPVTGDGSLADAAQLDGPRNDFGIDGPPFDPDAPTCPADPLWNANSSSFTVSNRPLLAPTPPPNPECQSDARFYEFDAIGRTLSELSCVDFRRFRRVRHLDDNATNQIVSLLRVIRTICTPSCRVGLAQQTLTVRDTAGCVQRSYDNNGCAAVSPPLVAADDLAALLALLDELLSAACEIDGGSKDGGDCSDGTNLCRVAPWPADAGARPVVDAGVCGGNPLWRDFNSFTFTMTSFPNVPPPDGGCVGSTVTYNLFLQTKMLYQSGCVRGRTTYHRVELIDSQIDAIANQFATLRTSCRTTCLADGLQANLSLFGCNSELLDTFRSEANPPCNLPPTEWAMGALTLLGGMLDGIISESCGAPGDAASPGACRPRCLQVIR